MFFIVVVTINILTNSVGVFPFLHILFLMMHILTDWYDLSVILICISVIISDFEHIIMCFLTFYVSSFRNVYSDSTACDLIGRRAA